MTQWWILVGMMGSGKSMVGRKLSEISGRPLQDTDQLLQNRFGRTIGKIFDIYGEAAFRDHETSVLKTLDPEAGILATGGGVIVRPQNRVELARLGKTIYLQVPPDKLIERLSLSRRRRPLLETENWEDRFRDLYESRREIYEGADLTFPVSAEDLEDTAAALHVRLMELGW
ncbi:MAG: AAA family ATPase [Chthonomonas sp.]|nr:AAA family ATPase [Chthonomonas sp.]